MNIDETVVFIAFVVSCVTAPTFGIIIGGYIVHKCGGYEGRKSLLICTLYGLCAFLTGIPIVFCNGILSFALFLWLFLFFGGSIVPNLTGIILSSLPNNLRAAGNSVTLFITTLIGFLPAPIVYGTIYEATKFTNAKRLAYGLIINYSVIALILITIGTIIREREFKKRIKKNETMKYAADLENKLQQNKSENENLKDNSEVKIESSHICLKYKTDINNNIKENFKLVDDGEIICKIGKDVLKDKEARVVKKARKKPKTDKVIKEVEDVIINKNNFTERKLIQDGEIIYKGKNGNEEIFEVKLRNASNKRKKDYINYYERNPSQILNR